MPAAKRPAASPGTAATAALSEPALRGLIVNHNFAWRFFRDGKTLELKNTQCRCVAINQPFYLVESGVGQNHDGVGVMRILGRLQFLGNMKLEWATLDKHFDEHRCSKTELGNLKSSWRKQSDTLVGWKVCVEDVFSQPLYVRAGCQDHEGGKCGGG